MNMQQFEGEKPREPEEIQELRDVLQEEYPNVEVTYSDWTQYKGSPPTFHTPEGSETFIKFGSTGNFRAELFVHAAKNALPDLTDKDNRILMYPSFDKEKNLSKLRLLRYSDSVTEEVLNEFNKFKDTFKLPDDYARIRKVPKIRVAEEKEGNYISIESVPNSENVFISKYTPEKIEKVRNKSTSISWGEHTLLLYKNRDGENILLFLKNK